jgi:L-lactate dehydrogenase complex protein LldG
MEESTSKEKVLKYVREALMSKTDQPFPKIDFEKPVFVELEESPDINFAQELTAAGGMFIYCESADEVINGIKFLVTCLTDHDQLTQAHVGITGCESLVARLGSVMVSTGQMAGRQIFIFPEIHIVVARASQLVPDLKDALLKLKKKYDQRMPSMVTLITGPSRTADIEKTLVMGAHGPKELFVFFLEDRL